MKQLLSATWLGLAALGGFGIGPSLQAQSSNTVDRVLMKDGHPWQAHGSRVSLLEAEVKLPHGILVQTNGTYTVNKGKVRELSEGQILGADGMLTSPDGSILPVYDHVVMKAGKPKLFKDGTGVTIEAALTLGDGTQIQPDGFILTRDGRRLRLLDGQFFRLDGRPVAAKDSITVKNGKVTVQKDGSLLTVAPGRSLMMNDGTKVLGDGTVIMKDGTPRKLAEGEMITVEGVVTRR